MRCISLANEHPWCEDVIETPVDERQLKIQEKNRRARRRFRERQKVRYSGMRGQLQELTDQVEELQSEIDRLNKLNADLVHAYGAKRPAGAKHIATAGAAGGATGADDSPASGEHCSGTVAAVQLQEEFPMKTAGRQFNMSASMFAEVPGDALLDMWAQLVNEISDTLTQYELTMTYSNDRPASSASQGHAKGPGLDGGTWVPPSASAGIGAVPSLAGNDDDRPRAPGQQGGSSPQAAGYAATLQGVLEEKLQRLVGVYCKLSERGLLASPLRIRRLVVSSHFRPAAASQEQLRDFHEHVTAAMRLGPQERRATGAAYLKFRQRMEASALRRAQLLEAACKPPPDVVRYWESMEHWVCVHECLDAARQTLAEDNKHLVEFTRELTANVWSPAQFGRLLKAARPRLADLTLVAHILAAAEGMVPPIRAGSVEPEKPFSEAAEAAPVPDC